MFSVICGTRYSICIYVLIFQLIIYAIYYTNVTCNLFSIITLSFCS